MTTLIGVNTRNIKAEDVVDVIEDTAAGDTTAAKKFVSGLSDDLKANSSLFSGKSVYEIAQALTDAGYDVTVKASTRSRSGAQIIKINNPGGGKNISQVQVSPGGGRHCNNYFFGR